MSLRDYHFFGGGVGGRFFWSGRKEFANLKAQQQTKNKANSKQQQSKNKTVEVSFATQHVTGSYMGLYLHSPQTGNTYPGPNLSYYRLSKTKYSDASLLSELSSTDNLNLLSAHKGDVTRHDSQRRFLAQHSVAMLEQCCNHSKQWLNNVATLCCPKNRLHESSHAEHHL